MVSVNAKIWGEFRMKETYRTDSVEKFTANYESANSMERYYQQRKMRFLYDSIKIVTNDNPDKIADSGAGEGIFLDIAKSFNQSIATIGLDIASEHCKTINKKGHYSICGDAENLPIEDNSLDAVFLLDVIEHFFDAKVLDEIYRILKVGGMLLLSTPNKYGIYEYKEWVYFGMHLKGIFNSLRGKPRSYFPYHVNLYSKREIVRTLETHGFSVETVNTMGFCLPFFGNLNHFLKIYESKKFLRVLEYFEKMAELLNFLIVVRCRKIQ